MKSAKIIKIIDTYTAVINKGEKDDVQLGDLYLIYEMGEELFDPDDSSKSLGKLEIVKGRGKVGHVQENVSTIEAIKEKRSGDVKTTTTTNESLFEELISSVVVREAFETEEQMPFKNVKLGDFAKVVR